MIIPALNEEASIAEVVRHIPREVVTASSWQMREPRRQPMARATGAGAETLAAGCGHGRACLAGALASTDCDIVVFMDGDGADDPAAIGRLVEPIIRGERILSSRRARGGRVSPVA